MTEILLLAEDDAQEKFVGTLIRRMAKECQAPDQKCEKGRYKDWLFRAVLDAGVQPLLGGIEYAEDLADRLDVQRAARAHPSFKRFVDAPHDRLNLIKG
jgi:hypothetical protein